MMRVAARKARVLVLVGWVCFAQACALEGAKVPGSGCEVSCESCGHVEMKCDHKGGEGATGGISAPVPG